jgi:hypothetical protein
MDGQNGAECKGGGNAVALYCERQIHEIHGLRSFRKFPLDIKVRFIHALLKVFPSCLIRVSIVDDPSGANIVDKTVVVPEVGFKFDKQLILVDCIVDGGILWGRWGAHCSAIVLDPGGVTEGEDDVHHYDFPGFD